MATDVRIGNYLLASGYARAAEARPGRLQVRGTVYPVGEPEWSCNTFTPDEFRALARYMLELADDAEKPTEELAASLIEAYKIYGRAEGIAAYLIEKGYHK